MPDEEKAQDSDEIAKAVLETGMRVVTEIEKPQGAEADWRFGENFSKNILHEEIGMFGPWTGAEYEFDQETRDRLLAHSRQDVARIAYVVNEANHHIHKLLGLARWIATLLVILLLVCGYIAVSL